MVLKDPLRSTEELYTVSMQVEEHGQRTALSITDTPGFRNGATAEHQLRFIAKYIDYQFERTLAEVLGDLFFSNREYLHICCM